MGLPDPDMNPRLRAAVNAAKAQSMPKDNIQRAIDKASGGDAENYEEVRYEGYGPGGVALLVEGTTDNRNRTVSEVRHIFTKHGGNLGTAGCVAYMFQPRGYIALPADKISEDDLMALALDAGSHRVLLHHRPRGFSAGLGLAGLGLLALGLLRRVARPASN